MKQRKLRFTIRTVGRFAVVRAGAVWELRDRLAVVNALQVQGTFKHESQAEAAALRRNKIHRCFEALDRVTEARSYHATIKRAEAAIEARLAELAGAKTRRGTHKKRGARNATR